MRVASRLAGNDPKAKALAAVVGGGLQAAVVEQETLGADGFEIDFPIFRTGKRLVQNSSCLGYADAHVLDQAAVCHGFTSSNANITHIP